MTRVSGTFYDGIGSRGHAATLTVVGDLVVIKSETCRLEVAFCELEVEARLGTTPRRMSWGDRCAFVSSDHAAVDALTAELPRPVSLSWVAWLEARLVVALVALLIVAATGVGAAVWGVPAMAEVVAFALPEEVSDQLGDTTLANIGELLAPSEVPEARQASLREHFLAHGPVKRLEFKKSEVLGANAFALSGTTVALTDGLVALTSDDDELLAVYLHELGHAELRHVERSVLQGSAWLVMMTLITGDLAGVGELILTLPLVFGQTAYSREFERAADEFAVDVLVSAGISPTKLATILSKLEQSHTAPDGEGGQEPAIDADVRERPPDDSRVAEIVFDYLSTHPATRTRIAYIESRAAEIAAGLVGPDDRP
jgi:Zn-dependent protease with chaperone function